MRAGRGKRPKAHNPALRGTWWTCAEHGLTDNAILLGRFAYCPAGDCTRKVRLENSIAADLASSPRTDDWRNAIKDDAKLERARARSRPPAPRPPVDMANAPPEEVTAYAATALDDVGPEAMTAAVASRMVELAAAAGAPMSHNYARQALSYAVARGQVRRVRRGVYALPAAAQAAS